MRWPVLTWKPPKLRLFQQMIVGFVVVVLLPLLAISVVLYMINQTALRKELAKFTEHTSEGIYTALQTEMTWQQDQARLFHDVFWQALKNPVSRKNSAAYAQAAQTVFQLSGHHEALGVYSANGLALGRFYANYARLSPELRLPETLPLQHEQLQAVSKSHLQYPQYKVLYSNAQSAKQEDSTYSLRVTLRLAPLVGTKTQDDKQQPAFLVLQKPFAYLGNLIHRYRQSLYDGVFVFDNTGQIIAGPANSVAETHFISKTDFAFFNTLQDGITQEFASSKLQEDEDDRPLEKVFVKMPDIHWGILIESPYHVRQKFIKRARNQSLMLIGGYLGLVILFLVFYVLGIHRNFRQLIKGIKAIASGNYSRRIRLITNWATPYEIMFLTGEFNRMAKKMSDAWQRSQQLNQELTEANQQLAKLDEMKSNLIDTVSHELRTPLTSIKGYTSRLLRYEGTLDADMRRQNLRVIKQQADRLSRLVEDLLVIPELDRHTLRVFPDRVELWPLLKQCIQFIQQKDPAGSQIEVSGIGPEDPEPLCVLTDPDRLEQVLVNLLDNAIKYSPEAARITLAVHKTSAMLEIVLSNPLAEPLPPGALKQLGQKFKRLDESTTRTTRGSGLGLFITKGLVEALQGRLAFATTPTTFSVTLGLPYFLERSE